jgi:hypothetical protein
VGAVTVGWKLFGGVVVVVVGWRAEELGPGWLGTGWLGLGSVVGWTTTGGVGLGAGACVGCGGFCGAVVAGGAGGGLDVDVDVEVGGAVVGSTTPAEPTGARATTATANTAMPTLAKPAAASATVANAKRPPVRGSGYPGALLEAGSTSAGNAKCSAHQNFSTATACSRLPVPPVCTVRINPTPRA